MYQQLGWFMHPIFSKNGDYPQMMIDRIAAMSKQQGFKRSRLPQFTHEEILRIHNTSDFFGINSYTTVLVSRNDRNNSANFPEPSFNHDMGVVETADPNWPLSGSVWLRVSSRWSRSMNEEVKFMFALFFLARPDWNVQSSYVDSTRVRQPTCLCDREWR